MEEMNYRGQWWLPDDDPEDAVAGEFTFDPENGGNLELYGAFRDVGSMNSVEDVPAVLGTTTDGHMITLRECSIRPGSFATATASARTESCTAREVFVDYHFPESEAVLDRIDVSFPLLEDWAQINAIINPSGNPSRAEIREVDPIEAKVGETEIAVKIEATGTMQDFRGAELTQETYIRIEPEEPLGFNTYLDDYIKQLQHFFSLGIGKPLNPSKIKGYVDLEDGGTQDVNVGYQVARSTDPGEKIHPSRLNFTLRDIEFEDALQSWFENYEMVETLHNLYFATVFHDMYVQNQFLSLVTGLESYHRELYPDQHYMDRDDYNDLVEQIEGNMPDVAAKERIINLLESGIGNQYSLKDRLEEITDDHSMVLEELMDVHRTVRDVRDERHNLAHGLESDAELEELHNLSGKLRVIIEVCLLDALNLDDDHILEKMETNHGHVLD